MNPLLLLLFEAGVNIAKGHVKNKAGGEVLDTTSFILDAAQAIDALHQEENGTPLDWSSIKHHQPLPPAGQPTIRETAGPTGNLQDESRVEAPAETEQPAAQPAEEPAPETPPAE